MGRVESRASPANAGRPARELDLITWPASITRGPTRPMKLLGFSFGRPLERERDL